MSSSRRSIMKSTDRRNIARHRFPKKRLSFAPSPEEKKKTEEENGDDGQFDSVLAPTDLSCKMTSLGLCYDPEATPRMERQHDSIPMKKSHRNNLTSVLNFTSLSGTTVNVLIVGEKILSEKFKAYLLEMHHKQHTTRGLKWRMDLNIKCEKTLTPAMTPSAHFIILLFMMDAHESMMYLTRILIRFTEDILPSKRMLVVTVSSAHGCFKNVVDLDQFHILLNSHHLTYLPWKEQGRFGQIEVKRILDLIYKSVGYHRGASLLMDYIIQLSTDWFVEEIEAQDSESTIV